MGELTDIATEWMDRHRDPDTGLLWNMEGSFDELTPPRSIHLVAQSAWYAAALLLRGAAGDEGRAVQTIEAVLDTQYDEPGGDWHGTFARFLETPRPTTGAVMWVDYDPNWRQFVGTTFELLLKPGQPGANLDAALRGRMRDAIAMAVDSEPPDRVPPTYSNIALMRAWLEVEHDRAGALDYARQVVEAFDVHGAFEEYNSPTYYGIDLYALALWRDHSSSAELREWGARIETALWRDIARWYHPTLRNLCGPWSRSYGMDMCTYVSLLGLWMRPVVGPASAPFPDPSAAMEHSHDFCLAALIEHLQPRVPDEVLPALTQFSGEHSVTQTIASAPHRVASGWLSDTVMTGGEDGELTVSAKGQFHPATVHWLLPDGGIGWMRLVHNGPARAVAAKSSLDVRCYPHRRHGLQRPELVVHAAGLESCPPSRRLLIPGLDVELSVEPEDMDDNDARAFKVQFPTGTHRIRIELSTSD